MIINLQKFIFEEKNFWVEFEKLIIKIESEPGRVLSYQEIKRFHYLYQRISGDLSIIKNSAGETEILNYIENLISRAYNEINEIRGKSSKFNPVHWFLFTFPNTFRSHYTAFILALIIFLAGAIFGAGAIFFDSEAKSVIIPFEGLHGNPAERISIEESGKGKDRLDNKKSSFSAYLMTHNTRVAIFIFALGMTFGIGSAIMLFYNGIILGAVIMDYCRAGYSIFLTGWLLPHGSVEITAILLSGQASFILANSLLAKNDTVSNNSISKNGKDIIVIISGCSLMLIWAGIIESFFSQYHQPVLPYYIKILFGIFEVIFVYFYLFFVGHTKKLFIIKKRK